MYRLTFGQLRLPLAVYATVFLTATFFTPLVAAQTRAQTKGVEEVIVTAQRTEESVQDVPISVTALTAQALQEKQIITPSDLQMNSPNVSYTPTNFGSNSFSIRGIGRLVTASTGDAGVSTHTNEIAVGPNLNTAEFYDVARVEVLRGPQGTLYGRNATGGAVNIVTNMPNFDGMSGMVDVEAGDYDASRYQGMFNWPITDSIALRFAGMKLKRDGYTDNLAHNQVGLDGQVLSGIDDDLDGRDFYDYRITALWEINDDTRAWLIYNRSYENDDRARITNQECVRSEIPTYGCEPNEVGFEQPNETSNFFNVVAMLFGYLPPGAPTLSVANGGAGYNWPRPTLDLRKQHTDFEPVFKQKVQTVMGSFTYDFDKYTATVQGAYADSDLLSQEDYWMDVGANVAPSPYSGSPNYPISAALPAGKLAEDGPCGVYQGTAGNYGGCTLLSDLTRTYSFDQSDSNAHYWTAEAKVQSQYDGPFNFIVGVSGFDFESYGDYYVNGNMGDAVPWYPGFFDNFGPTSGATYSDGWAGFGEAYYNITDTIKVTAGLRYNDDHKKLKSSTVLWNSEDLNFNRCTGPDGIAVGDFTYCTSPIWGGAFGATEAPLWSRLPVFAAGLPAAGEELELIELYDPDADLAAADASPPYSAERLSISSAVPIAPEIDEARELSNSPNSFTWEEWSGRIGVDWAITDNSMAYLFYSRGYKPGGANPAVPTEFQGVSQFSFDKEKIDAYEIGSKNTLFENTLVLNGALFWYDYQGLQVARIKNNTALNENIDAQMLGFELEATWRPEFLPNLQLDAQYSYLDSEVRNTDSVDPLNRTGGDPDFLTFNTIGFVYAARRSDITQQVVDTAVALGAAFPWTNAMYNETQPDGSVRAPAAGVPDNTPIVFVSAAAEALGVEVTEGVPVDLDGNELPNSPKNTIHIGAAYTWNLDFLRGSLTPRVDYYWQDDSYAREFNTVGDEIDSWDQWNAQLIYDSLDGKWQVRAWIRNIQDEDNVTGHYVTSDTSGYYRNYFLTEPRVYGAAVRYQFGAG